MDILVPNIRDPVNIGIDVVAGLQVANTLAPPSASGETRAALFVAGALAGQYLYATQIKDLLAIAEDPLGAVGGAVEGGIDSALHGKDPSAPQLLGMGAVGYGGYRAATYARQAIRSAPAAEAEEGLVDTVEDGVGEVGDFLADGAGELAAEVGAEGVLGSIGEGMLALAPLGL